MDEMNVKSYDMKKVPAHVRGIVEELVMASDIFFSDYDNEENLIALAENILKRVKQELGTPEHA